MKYIDIHAHLAMPNYDADREDVIMRARDAEVAIVNVGTDLKDSRMITEIADTYRSIHPHLYSIPGIHPHWVQDKLTEILSAVCSSSYADPLTNSDLGKNGDTGSSGSINSFDSAQSTSAIENRGPELTIDSFFIAKKDIVKEFHFAEEQVLSEIDIVLTELSQIAEHQSVIGIGECGIDVFGQNSIFDPFTKNILALQEKLFVGQIEIALRLGKPIMIHARESYTEILSILDQRFISKGIALRGNVHFFAGTSQEARMFLDRGFTVSFTGVITFARAYEAVVSELPVSSIMSETDCPFVSPVPHRGKRNEPAYVVEVVSKIARIRDMDPETLRIQLLTNAETHFSLNLSGPFA